MKKFLTVLCLALLLTLVCTSAMAAIGSKYKSNGKEIDSITTYQGETINPAATVVVKEPKCTTGIARITNVLGTMTFEISIDPIHDLELKTLDGKIASCDNPGYGYYTCKDCGAVDPYGNGQVLIPAKEHKFDKVVIDQQATCYANGKSHKVCIYCGKAQEDPLHPGVILYDLTNPAKHTPVYNDHNPEIVIAPTCEEQGKGYLVCQLCGEPERVGDAILYRDGTTLDVLKATGHKWSDWVVTTPAACNKGLETRSCTVCGKSQTQELAAIKPHTYQAVCTNVYGCKASGGNALAATSAEARLVMRCTTCGDEHDASAAEYAAANYMDHHKFVEDPTGENYPAECKGAVGKKTFKCTICGGRRTIELKAPTEHSWGAWECKVAPGTNGVNGVWERHCTNYHCIEKETYVGKTAPSGAAPAPTSTTPSGTTPPSGTESYKITSWSFTGSGVSGQVAGNVSYRTPGLSVNVIIYTPNGTFLATSATVDENGKFSVSAGGAVYAVSIQLKDNTKTYQTDGKYV